ncbi:hypothetical protein YC2023_075875 [Brassica napus]
MQIIHSRSTRIMFLVHPYSLGRSSYPLPLYVEEKTQENLKALSSPAYVFGGGGGILCSPSSDEDLIGEDGGSLGVCSGGGCMVEELCV